MLDLYLQQSLITHFGNVRTTQNWKTTRHLFPTVGVSSQDQQ